MAGLNLPLNTAVDDRDLCAWQPAMGIVWIRIQTRVPKHARRMKQRHDGRLVAVGVADGFLRTYEFEQSLSWAIALPARYIFDEKATNEPLTEAIYPRTNLSCRT